MNSLSASFIDSISSNDLRSSTIAHSSEDRSPDPEVIEIATRRQFSASEKRISVKGIKAHGVEPAALRMRHNDAA
jgi:hypothetical protein